MQGVDASHYGVRASADPSLACKRAHRAAPRVAFQQLINGHGRLVHRCRDQTASAIERLQRGNVTENRHPRQGEVQRDQQYAKDEFTDRPPPGNASDEQAGEGRPVTLSAGAAILGVEVECVQIVAQILYQTV